MGNPMYASRPELANQQVDFEHQGCCLGEGFLELPCPHRSTNLPCSSPYTEFLPGPSARLARWNCETSFICTAPQKCILSLELRHYDSHGGICIGGTRFAKRSRIQFSDFGLTGLDWQNEAKELSWPCNYFRCSVAEINCCSASF